MVGSQSIETLNGFCHFKLWDPYLTWEYTPFPDLTPCFQYTVLAMLPMLVFVISFPLELLFSVKTYSGIIPWNSNNLTKLVLTLILVLINCFQVLLTCFHSSLDDVPSAAAFTSPFIKLITFVLLAYSEHKRRKVGITSSGAQSIFWLLEFFASSLIYQSNINHLLFKESIIPNIHLLQIHILTVPITFARFLLCFKADHRPLYTLEDDSCPESWSSYFSKLVYYWFNPLITAGFKKPLQQDDLWDLSSDKTSDEILEDFEKYWKKELFKAKSSGWDTSLLASEQKPNVKYPSIFYPLLRAFWPSVLTALLQKLSSDTLNLVRPLMLGCLINFVARQEPLWKGFLYSIFLLSATELQSIVLSLYTLKTSVIGMKIKIALTSEIYKKALVISNEEKQKSTLGEIVNLMALDTQRFMDLMPLLLVLVSAPFQISLILYFLSLKLGKAVIGGLLLMMLMIPVNTIVAVFMKKYQTKNMELKDDRTKLINEVLSGIKVIKFHAWEVPFSRIITKIRDAEVKILKIIAYFIACLNFIWNCTPFLISLVSFGLFVMISDDNILTADVAFVSLTLFQLLRAPLNLLPSVISLLVQSMVSIKRIDKFLQSKNLNPNHFKRSKKKGSDAVVIESASYSWSSQHEDPVLKNINLNVPKGKLVAVVGKVGSGKSSLLSSILGELNKCNGNIKLEGSVAYIPQTAWIQNATLIDNIIMFKPFNKTLYSHTIEACALVPDLNVLPGGDRTEIGEKGINLSGGQKQRVSLARSVYQNADIYLLDDPLSAVDAHVGKHIFENVIGPNGILKNKTRIFVTNNISYLSQCDMVVVLKDKTVAMKGTYNELIKKYNEFEKLVSTNSQTQVQNDEEENDCADDLSNSFESKLIKTETAEVFRVKSKVYTTYLKKIGLKISFAILSIQMLSEVCAVARNLWLSDWSNDAIHFKGIVNHEVQNIRFIVYGAIGIGQGLSTLFGALFLAYGSMKASKALHEMMLSNTLSSPMSFFDTTPIGRIVNRFSKDVNVLDMNIMGNFRLWLVILLQVFSTLCVTVIAIPYIIIIIIPTSIFYYMVQIRYIASSRQLKRLESISRSPIYSHFSETIVGASSIRAYDFVNTFIRQLHKKIDENNKSFYLSVIASRWLAIRLEFIANIITFFVALLVVINKQSMNPGEVGLVLTYVFTLTTCLNTLVTQTALVETDIVSVERMLEYCNLPSEAPWDQDLDRCQRTWPKHGKISFQSYSTRYRPGLDLVLKDINIDINGGEKIGICGRTGAGKSSLILAILRLVEAHKGKILIDGVDISKLGLHKIRSSITIIPQDPVLFSGTVRNNLDPFENYNDSELWNILEHVNMKTYFRKQSGGLDFIIGEGGENLSTGQRQLLCLARAMLCDSKILVLDEATAGIDHTTDKLIQETLRREFADCTVLTIAHRLNTIIDDSTRVLVLDNGEVAEFDTVDNLLARKNIFYDMAIDAGIVD